MARLQIKEGSLHVDHDSVYGVAQKCFQPIHNIKSLLCFLVFFWFFFFVGGLGGGTRGLSPFLGVEHALFVQDVAFSHG